MSAALRYFELQPDVGEPGDPITSVSLDIVVPTMSAGELVELSASVILAPADRLAKGDAARVIPDSRIVEARDHVVADRLANHPLFAEVDKPSKKHLATMADGAAAARNQPVPDDLKEQ